MQFLYLTTLGHRSRQPREIEIWFTTQAGKYYLIAERREQAGWVQNILHNPRVSFRVGAQSFSGTGRVVSEADERDLWQSVRRLSDRKYGWSDGLVVELSPDAVCNSSADKSK